MASGSIHFWRKVGNAEFFLSIGDISRQEADALVTAANSRLAGGGGVDGAIHAAGGPTILAQCRQLKGCPTGKAVVTGAGNLKAKMVVHAVGPMWSGGHKGEPELLRSAYRESLLQAERHEAKSIIFPSISTGAYGYPIDRAAPIAIQTIVDFLRTSDRITSAGIILFSLAEAEVYDRAAREIVDRPGFGCYWSYFQEHEGLYLHPLHFNGVGEPRSNFCAKVLRDLSQEVHWEEDTLRLLDDRGWREHLGAALSFYLCPRRHPAILRAIWKAMAGGSWVSPQLLVVLSQRDPDFGPRLEELLSQGVQMEGSGDPMADHVHQGPGDSSSRLGKIAAAALGLATLGLWQPTEEMETRARKLAESDYDGAQEIAVSWLDSLRKFEQAEPSPDARYDVSP